MALLNKIRKDIKKSSYYVWFLGAQECKGLRGAEYITPVLRSLIQREKTVEPFKITLQVSHKGLKIVQNLSNLSPKKSDPKPNKNDVIKHVIPHHAVTSVYQDEDVVACVLLLYNPVTRCPVHVHAYRCDTVETATLLSQQLSTLIERPENQRKLNDIEARLRAKGLLLPTVPRVNIPKRMDSCGSDGRSTTSPASESSGGSSGGGQDRLSHLYDSLASELREKLGMSTDGKVVHAPILLPPRDYDTVHRTKGNLTGIELRRCLNESITGKPKGDGERKTSKTGRLGRILGSSGGSSGIGSDHPPSPDHHMPSTLTHSTSEEEWTEQPSEDSMFLMENSSRGRWRGGENRPHTRKRSETPPEQERRSTNESPFRRSEENLLRERDEVPQKQREDTLFRNPNHWSTPNLNIPIEIFRKRNEKGNMSPVGVVAPRRRTSEEKHITEKPVEVESYKKRIPGYKEKQRDDTIKQDNQVTKPSKTKGRLPDGTMKLSPQERFLDAKTKFLLLEKERLEEQEKNLQNIEKKRNSQTEAPISPEIIKMRPHWSREERTLADRAGIIRKNSFFDDEPTKSDKRDDRDMRKKRLSRSDSRGGPYYSQERLDGVDIEYDPREHGKSPFSEKSRNSSRNHENNDGFDNRIRGHIENKPRHERLERRDEKNIERREMRRDESREGRRQRDENSRDRELSRRRSDREEFYPDSRRASRRSQGQERPGYQSPATTPSDDDDRWHERNKKYSADHRGRYNDEPDTSPPRPRYDENERRLRYDEQRYKSPLRRSDSRRRETEQSVPFDERREKNKYQAIEHEKRMNSNALAKEFKRRSYQDQVDKVEMAISRGFIERELDERRRSSSGVGYIPDEPDRRSDYCHDVKKQDRRPRGYSYEEEEGRDRRPSWRGSGGDGYQVLWDRDRPPGLDRDTARLPHISQEYSDRRDEKARFEAGGRLSQAHVDKLPARYRHSFVEQAGMAGSARGRELLHRTNSSVSSNRVGIAAVHPY